MIRTYSELMRLPTYEERLQYLMLNGRVGEDTFGSRRYLNQVFYRSYEWQKFRKEIILRDKGCDLGLEGYEILGKIYIHHINPIYIKDIEEKDLKDIIIMYNDTPEENEKKLHEEEEKSLKLIFLKLIYY